MEPDKRRRSLPPERSVYRMTNFMFPDAKEQADD
jgi:hypothetical protein